jgi:hypothetical protein
MIREFALGLAITFGYCAQCEAAPLLAAVIG